MGPHGRDNFSGHRNVDPWDSKLDDANFMLQFSHYHRDFLEGRLGQPSVKECREHAMKKYPYIDAMSQITGGWEKKYGPIDATSGYSKGADFAARLMLLNNNKIARICFNGENQIVGPNIHLFATAKCELTLFQGMMLYNVIYTDGNHAIDGTSAYIPIDQTWDQTHSCYGTGSSQHTNTNQQAYSSRDSSRAPIYTPVILFEGSNNQGHSSSNKDSASFQRMEQSQLTSTPHGSNWAIPSSMSSIGSGDSHLSNNSTGFSQTISPPQPLTNLSHPTPLNTPMTPHQAPLINQNVINAGLTAHQWPTRDTRTEVGKLVVNTLNNFNTDIDLQRPGFSIQINIGLTSSGDPYTGGGGGGSIGFEDFSDAWRSIKGLFNNKNKHYASALKRLNDTFIPHLTKTRDEMNALLKEIAELDKKLQPGKLTDEEFERIKNSLNEKNEQLKVKIQELEKAAEKVKNQTDHAHRRQYEKHHVLKEDQVKQLKNLNNYIKESLLTEVEKNKNGIPGLNSHIASKEIYHLNYQTYEYQDLLQGFNLLEKEFFTLLKGYEENGRSAEDRQKVENQIEQMRQEVNKSQQGFTAGKPIPNDKKEKTTEELKNRTNFLADLFTLCDFDSMYQRISHAKNALDKFQAEDSEYNRNKVLDHLQSLYFSDRFGSNSPLAKLSACLESLRNNPVLKDYTFTPPSDLKKELSYLNWCLKSTEEQSKDLKNDQLSLEEYSEKAHFVTLRLYFKEDYANCSALAEDYFRKNPMKLAKGSFDENILKVYLDAISDLDEKPSRDLLDKLINNLSDTDSTLNLSFIGDIYNLLVDYGNSHLRKFQIDDNDINKKGMLTVIEDLEAAASALESTKNKSGENEKKEENSSEEKETITNYRDEISFLKWAIKSSDDQFAEITNSKLEIEDDSERKVAFLTHRLLRKKEFEKCSAIMLQHFNSKGLNQPLTEYDILMGFEISMPWRSPPCDRETPPIPPGARTAPPGARA